MADLPKGPTVRKLVGLVTGTPCQFRFLSWASISKGPEATGFRAFFAFQSTQRGCRVTLLKSSGRTVRELVLKGD